MAVESFKVFTGYYGFYPLYHEIFYEVEDKIHPKHKTSITQVKLSRCKYQQKKPKIKVKRSENYEGNGRNYKD